LVAVVSGVAGLSAFEAHVINVTAKIENALNVSTYELTFGTVFPQEALEQKFDVYLSESFLAEDRVDDVEYVLRQRPKCANDPVDPTEFSQVVEDGQGNFVGCANPEHEILPLLCPYLSKSEITGDGTAQENDGEEILAFHGPIVDWTLADTFDWQTGGQLVKAAGDELDTWLIDLKVPCFGNNCAQDWESFVLGVNASAAPAAYVQPIENESKTFGCDLWVEVFNVSLPNGGIPCDEDIDLMLVLDRSGSIDSSELATLKTAAKAFVDALVPSADGVHIGMVSFSSAATLDQELTGVGQDVKDKIDLLSSGGLTNLEDALLDAAAELASVRDRDDSTVPDFIVLITDGAPTTSNMGGDHAANATAAATAAKAAGIEIFVVGVGTTGSTATYLETSIASTDPPEHYFDAADFDDLEAILQGLTECPA